MTSTAFPADILVVDLDGTLLRSDMLYESFWSALGRDWRSPLRAGLATSFEKFALTGGLGLHTGPVHVDFAFGRWGMGGGDGFVSALSMSLWPGF